MSVITTTIVSHPLIKYCCLIKKRTFLFNYCSISGIEKNRFGPRTPHVRTWSTKCIFPTWGPKKGFYGAEGPTQFLTFMAPVSNFYLWPQGHKSTFSYRTVGKVMFVRSTIQNLSLFSYLGLRPSVRKVSKEVTKFQFPSNFPTNLLCRCSFSVTWQVAFLFSWRIPFPVSNFKGLQSSRENTFWCWERI